MPVTVPMAREARSEACSRYDSLVEALPVLLVMMMVGSGSGSEDMRDV